MNDLRYRIKKGTLEVVAIQDLDLLDYNESDWLEDHRGEPFEVKSEEQAEMIVKIIMVFSPQESLRLLSRVLEYEKSN